VLNNDQDLQRLVANLPIDTGVDPAHKQATRQRMLEQFAQAHTTPARPQGPLGWVRSLSVKTKSLAALAAVLVIAAGILAVVYYGGGAKIALADVQQRLAAVPVLTFRVEMSRPNGMTFTAQMYATEDHVVRFEIGDIATIIDFPNGRILSLMPRTHEAVESSLENLTEDQRNAMHRNWLEELQQIVGSKDAHPLGAKTVDGIRAVGWQLSKGDEIVTVWADEDTAELVRVECQKGQIHTAFDQFRYDMAIDSAKLSLTAPAGYTVHRVTIDANRTSEAEVIVLLRAWAMADGDVFPDTLDAMKFVQANKRRIDWEQVMKDYGGSGSSDPAQVLNQAFMWLNTNPGWSYAGAGVKFGDAQRPIFWYRSQGTGTWRVIYGDLHVEAAEAPPK
jgi:hypothetical protein